MELPFTERPMLIESGITPNVWALDTSGKPYLLDENSWRPVGNRRLKYITAGESGVWAVDNNDKILYREAVAPLAPTGAYWTEIPSEKLSKIDSGPSGIVLAINDESNLIIRQGISGNNPKGNGWQTIGTGYKNVSAGSYGIWALDSSNNVYFSPRTEIGPGIANLRWVPVGGKFAQIQAGFDGSVWALKDNGDVYRRESINAITPTGVSWKKVDGLKLSHVTTGLSGVYGIQKRIDKILKTEGKAITYIIFHIFSILSPLSAVIHNWS